MPSYLGAALRKVSSLLQVYDTYQRQASSLELPKFQQSFSTPFVL